MGTGLGDGALPGENDHRGRRASRRRRPRTSAARWLLRGAAGTTSTGAVDPLDQLADIAHDSGAWSHVDAAYGGALAFSEAHRHRLRRIERADSVTFDPHKWLSVSLPAAAVLVRDGRRVLREAFDASAGYLSEDRGGRDAALDFFRYGQLGTQRFDAPKIWMALKQLGLRGYSALVDTQVELTRYLATRLGALDDFELVGDGETAVCCARFLPDGLRAAEGRVQDECQTSLQEAVERGGKAWFPTTVVPGRRVLRFNVNSFLTEPRHIDELVELLQAEGAALAKERHGAFQ